MKPFIWKGFGFYYAHTVTSDGDTLKGGSFFVLHKQFLTVVIADSPWTDESDKPFKVAVQDGVLYIGKIAIGFK